MKQCIVFPGIGYHVDKPLLYYSKKLAAEAGFEIVDVPYGGFERNIKGDPVKMHHAFEQALEQAEEILREREISSGSTVLLLSKSIGTAVAAVWAARKGIVTRNIFFTPVEDSFEVMKDPGIVFRGTADPWLDQQVFLDKCRKAGYPYYLVEGGNHSLETGNAVMDLKNLQNIMDTVKTYIQTIA